MWFETHSNSKRCPKTTYHLSSQRECSIVNEQSHSLSDPCSVSTDLVITAEVTLNYTEISYCSLCLIHHFNKYDQIRGTLSNCGVHLIPDYSNHRMMGVE